MVRNIWPWFLTLIFAAATTGCAQAATLEKFVVLANGRTVGRLEASVAGQAITLDYLKSDNGRGSSSHEEITVGPDGMPTHWKVTGKSLVGAPMNEHFDWKPGRATWSGEADSGTVTVNRPRLYLANDASPWALGLYTRAALKAPGKFIDVVPAGTLQVEFVGIAPLTMKGRSVPNKVYRLTGLWMQPRYVVLAADNTLLATFSDGLMVRSGYEANTQTLAAFEKSLALDRMRVLQARLAHRYDTPIRIENVHIFDPVTGRIGPLAIVEVYRERITGVLPDTEQNRGQGDDEVVVDGEGGTLLAGLRDMHSHTGLDTGLFNLAAGVTSTRDMGNTNPFLQDLMARIDRGEIPGSRITPNGFIEGVSPYSASDGFLAATLPDALKDIKWYADRGYWQLKIYNSIKPDWVKPMAAEAHRLGMGVTGHIPAFTTADQMIRDGYDEIAHINQLMFEWVLAPGEDTRTTLRITGLNRLADVDMDGAKVKDTLALMREHHTVLDTTVAIQERLALSRSGRSQRGDLPFLEHVPVDYQRYRKRNFVVTNSLADEHKYEVAVEKMLLVIKALYDQGNRLMPGTDDGYGFALHRELELYVQAGIPAGEVLKIDTFDTAVYLHQDQDLGSIERGKYADLILVPGDPSADISLVRRSRMVMHGGVIYFPDEIYQALDIKPFSTRPPIHDTTTLKFTALRPPK